jgi:hypothetical protein
MVCARDWGLGNRGCGLRRCHGLRRHLFAFADFCVVAHIAYGSERVEKFKDKGLWTFRSGRLGRDFIQRSQCPGAFFEVGLEVTTAVNFRIMPSDLLNT